MIEWLILFSVEFVFVFLLLNAVRSYSFHSKMYMRHITRASGSIRLWTRFYFIRISNAACFSNASICRVVFSLPITNFLFFFLLAAETGKKFQKEKHSFFEEWEKPAIPKQINIYTKSIEISYSVWFHLNSFLTWDSSPFGISDMRFDFLLFESGSITNSHTFSECFFLYCFLVSFRHAYTYTYK